MDLGSYLACLLLYLIQQQQNWILKIQFCIVTTGMQTRKALLLIPFLATREQLE